MSASSRTVEHVGEWRVELGADSLPELFQELARVIARAAGRPSGSYGPWEQVDLEGSDREGLLVDYANELVGRSEVARRAYDDVRDIVIELEGRPRLAARVRGRPVASWRSPLKAATYHRAALSCDEGRCEAAILFDV